MYMEGGGDESLGLRLSYKVVTGNTFINWIISSASLIFTVHPNSVASMLVTTISV